jgi:hypothetical protein
MCEFSKSRKLMYTNFLFSFSHKVDVINLCQIKTSMNLSFTLGSHLALCLHYQSLSCTNSIQLTYIFPFYLISISHYFASNILVVYSLHFYMNIFIATFAFLGEYFLCYIFKIVLSLRNLHF